MRLGNAIWLRGTGGGGRSSDPVEDGANRKTGLGRKLTCSVLSSVALGVILILVIQVSLTSTGVSTWEENVKRTMVQLEEENAAKLASYKAEFVGEVFGRLEEGVQQLQIFAGEILLSDPQTLVIEDDLEVYSGLLQEDTSWDHSIWWVPR